MSVSSCHTTVDSSKKELVQHGTAAFPIACYHDDLSRDEVPWHWHEELEAGVILSGKAVFAAGNEKFELKAGEGFFVNSGILHGCWDLEGSGSKFHSLVFHPRLVGGSPDSVFYREYILPLMENRAMECIHLKPGVQWQADIMALIEKAWQSCVMEPYGYEFTVRSSLSEMVLLLRRNVPAAQKQPGGKAVRDGERIKRMLQFIHAHYGEQLTTEQIAQSAAVSESECLRCFRATIGTTPIRYLRQYRIQRAAELLTGGDMRVAAVAEQCGFQDVSYFTKTFRELKGCPPTEFRQK